MPIPENVENLRRVSAKSSIYQVVCSWIITGVLKPGEKRRLGILLQWNPDDAAVSAGECGTYSLTLVFDGVSAIPDTSDSSGLLWLTVGLAAAALAAGALYKRSRRIN